MSEIHLFIGLRHNYSCFPKFLFSGEQYQFDQMKDVCISQGSVVTFLRCRGLISRHTCYVSPGFFLPKIISIDLFLTTLFESEKGITF